MKLSKELRTNLAQELELCAKLMEGESDPRKQVFYFSAAYGATNRIINTEYDPDVHLADLVLSTSYQQIQTRLAVMASGDRTSDLPKEIFPQLIEQLRKLSSQIKKGDIPVDILERIWQTAYVATGNGYYLWKKGSIEL